ncbi:MAG: sulfate adenylyltransferase subunit CysN [Proteobacteria bacterium]|nr:sulfate adenylyltransferase subunit CysN [Pseudomonadota bacterium]
MTSPQMHEEAVEAAREILRRRMELLRFTTAGSVDDGKSTLIGRLLIDSKAVFEDQLQHVKQVTERSGREGVDLALITDGLRAEREQGITIDVAYRYFSTPKRSFIIADTPGHVQYTRNMVTGASTANAAVILVDARNGLVTQSLRHAFISNLLGIPHLIVAINKMDLVDYSEDVFEQIRGQFREWAAKLDAHDIQYIPISALHGDMVVERGENMPWYQGYTLLGLLENLEISADRNLQDFRFPVQLVCRPQTEELHDFRGYQGRVESGSVSIGDEVVALPSGLRSKVAQIVTFTGDLDQAVSGQSVTITLEDDIDISRGDMIVRPGNMPRVDNEFEAAICWMSDEPMQARKKYLIKHSTRTVRGFIKQLRYGIDVDSLHRDEEATELNLNEIGRCILKVQKPIFCDFYAHNRVGGAFIIIDELTNLTVGAGMVWRPLREPPDPAEG